jgi:hypothetical protein
VETGQLMFIAFVISQFILFRRLTVSVPRGAWRVLPYTIGSVAAFWVMLRVISFMPVA